MSEEKVNLLVEYIVKGQEQMRQIDSDLDKLAKKSDTATKATTKGEAASAKNTQTLGKQIPILRDLQPLMSGLGLSWITGASAIAAVGIGAMQANQAFQTWMAGMIGLAVMTSTLNGGQTTFVESTKSAADNAARLGISMKDYAGAMTTLDGATKNTNTSLGILNDAVSISHATGQPLDQVVKTLSDAFSNGVWSNGDFIQPGILALQTMEDNLNSLGATSQGFKNQVDDDWSSITESISTNIGKAISRTVTGLKIIGVDAWELLGIGKDGWLVKGIADFLLWCGNIDWSKIWSGIGTIWNNIWTGVRDFFVGIWDWITGHISINWDSVFSGLGNAWHNVWTGIANFFISIWNGIITAINWVIDKLDKIHVDLPSWLGGGTIGFNISPIGTVPMLANGGDIMSDGQAIVGDNGPELLNLPQGASVRPLNNSGPITIPIYIGDELLSQYVINDLNDIVRIRGGY